jgi:hypothetical protein
VLRRTRMVDPLTDEDRRFARWCAEGQVPDGVILGELRARVYERMPPGPDRTAALQALWSLHPEDVRELDAFRDRGRVKLHLVMYACAMAYRVNEAGERYEPANPDHDPEDFRDVDPKAAGMAQYLGRVWLSMDPAALREDGAREAQRVAELGTAEQRIEVLRILPALGLPRAVTASVAEAWGVPIAALAEALDTDVAEWDVDPLPLPPGSRPASQGEPAAGLAHSEKDE